VLHVCCSVIECVAVGCSVLLAYSPVPGCSRFPRRCKRVFCCRVFCSVLQYAAVMQRVAACCSVLQCVAVCCSVVQCVAVCCSVLLAYSHLLRMQRILSVFRYTYSICKYIYIYDMTLCDVTHSNV